MSRHYTRILQEVADNPDLKLSDIRLTLETKPLDPVIPGKSTIADSADFDF
jgi:hypothetical protein